MTIKELQNIAKKKGVKATNLNRKADIIRTIQRAEGNFECFGTVTTGVCSQTDCLWLGDCRHSSLCS
ncbi:MAG: SAP domain-containing protein [Nitrospirae bacterium]|nr:SAP domain-containing protein [Nitrospirota bacterium]